MDTLNYICFFMSLIITAIIMPVLIPVLRRMKFGQTIRDEGPSWHMKKSGTPTMGGICFLTVASVIAFVMCKDIKIRVGIIAALCYGVIGFADDFIKIIKKRNLGLNAKEKLICQILVSVIFGIVAVKFNFVDTSLKIPFTNFAVNLGWFYIPFITVFMVGVTNAVNLTDGLDGLATSVTVVVCAFFVFASLFVGEVQLSYYVCAIAGALLGFLIYNFYPAKVFMGDTGSLFLGGAISIFAIYLKLEILLVLVGFIYVLEALSVIIQVLYFKKTGKRVFLMAPIHHHFEMKGMKELSVVYLFCVITLICCMLSVMSVVFF